MKDQMDQGQQRSQSPEDLFDRSKRYARAAREFFRQAPKTVANREYERQGIRSSGSVAANYIESREALSKRDAAHRIRICRKESKETKLWVELTETGKNSTLEQEQQRLMRESDELIRIFTSIVTKLSP